MGLLFRCTDEGGFAKGGAFCTFVTGATAVRDLVVAGLVLLSVNILSLPSPGEMGGQQERAAVGGKVGEMEIRCVPGAKCNACRKFSSCDPVPYGNDPSTGIRDQCNCAGGHAGCALQVDGSGCKAVQCLIPRWICTPHNPINWENTIPACGHQKEPRFKIENDWCVRDACGFAEGACRDCTEQML